MLLIHVALVFYGAVAAFSFFLIPYAYFYYEEKEDGPVPTSKATRRNGAFKYTLFFIGIAFILFMFGLFIKPNILPPHIDLEWFKNLLIESRKVFQTT